MSSKVSKKKKKDKDKAERNRVFGVGPAGVASVFVTITASNAHAPHRTSMNPDGRDWFEETAAEAVRSEGVVSWNAVASETLVDITVYSPHVPGISEVAKPSRKSW